MTEPSVTKRKHKLYHEPRTELSHTERREASVADLSPQAVARYRAEVLRVYPLARYTIDGEFGRITQAPDRLISLPFSLIDPEAESFAWLDASLRTGDGNQWDKRTGPKPEPPVPNTKTEAPPLR